MLILSLPSEQIGKEMFDMLSMANQSTEDVFSLLDNLLKWTKSQIGKLNVVYQDFDIVGNIASVIEIFNLVAGMKNIKVNFPVYGKIEVHADMDMMKPSCVIFSAMQLSSVIMIPKFWLMPK